MTEHRCYIVRGGIPLIKSGLAVATRENGKENKAMRASPVSRVGMVERGKMAERMVGEDAIRRIGGDRSKGNDKEEITKALRVARKARSSV